MFSYVINENLVGLFERVFFKVGTTRPLFHVHIFSWPKQKNKSKQNNKTGTYKMSQTLGSIMAVLYESRVVKGKGEGM